MMHAYILNILLMFKKRVVSFGINNYYKSVKFPVNPSKNVTTYACARHRKKIAPRCAVTYKVIIITH